MENKIQETKSEEEKRIETDLPNIKPDYDWSMTPSKNAKEAIKFQATINTAKDESFVNRIQDEIKESITESTIADRKIERIHKKAEVLNVEVEKNTSYFNKHKPVLEFGGIDNSCDMSIMKLTYILMVIPYFLAAVFIKTPLRILSTIFEEFNKLLLSIAKFTLPAKLFFQAMIWGGIATSLGFLMYKIITSLFI